MWRFGEYPARFINSYFTLLLFRSEPFLRKTLAERVALLYPPLWRKTVRDMLQTIHTMRFADAAQAASAPRLPVNDGGRPGSAVALAERCMR
jgi:hypothetical protein